MDDVTDIYESTPEHLSRKYGWPTRIYARGYDAYLVGIQTLLDGDAAPIYRFPGGDSVVFECELTQAQ